MKTFTEYFNEAKLSSKKVKELFGDELFGEFLKKKERDTEFEKEVFKKIQQYVKQNSVSSELIKFLKMLRDSKVHFPDILKPNAKVAFRGSVIEFDDLPHYSNLKVTKKEDQFVFKIKNYTYKPHRKIQSFSSNFTSAAKFNDSIVSVDAIPVVYEVKVNDDFLFSTKLTNLIAGSVGLDNEDEIIRISGKSLETTLFILAEYV